MKCQKCGGDLVFVEEVMGSFFFKISEDGEILSDSKDFLGETSDALHCNGCNEDFDFVYSGNKIVLIEEDIGEKITIDIKVEIEIEINDVSQPVQVNNYEKFVNEGKIDPNETHSWIELIEKAIETYNLQAMVIYGKYYTSLIGKEKDIGTIEEILYYVEETKTTVDYIFEGEVYIIPSDERLLVGKEAIILHGKKEIATAWNRDVLEANLEACFRGIQSVLGMPIDEVVEIIRDLHISNLLEKKDPTETEEFAIQLFFLNKDIGCIMHDGYIQSLKYADYDNQEIIKHTPATLAAWKIACHMYRDDETRMVDALIKNDDPNFPVGWIIDEYNTETGDQKYVRVSLL